MSSKKTVSLVLGSGGARGLAHIGVIEQIIHNGMEIKAISGSSMGALIGGIYAMGKLDTYSQWVTALQRSDVIRLLDLSFGRNGLIKGDRIMAVLKNLIGDANIEELPLKFTAVATDLDDENEVWLSHGPLFDAIRASIAIPTIFTPHQYQDRQLLDGGLVNPIPVAPTLQDDTDLTIAVNLSSRPDPVVKHKPVSPKTDNALESNHQRRITQFVDDLWQHLGRQGDDTLGMLDIMMKSMGIVENALAEAQLRTYSPDVVVDIPRDACNFYEFHRARELIEVGRRQTEIALARKADVHA